MWTDQIGKKKTVKIQQKHDFWQNSVCAQQLFTQNLNISHGQYPRVHDKIHVCKALLCFH